MSIRILKGDCLEVMKTLPDKSIDLFICDLPYGVLSKGNPIRKRFVDGKDTGTLLQGQTIGACEWDVKIDLEKFWKEIERLMKNEHTPILHFCNTGFGHELISSKKSWFRYDLIWQKTKAVGFLLANKMPLRSHENIYVFAKKSAYYVRKDEEGDFKGYTGGKLRAGLVYGTGLYNRSGGEGKRCVKSIVPIGSVSKHGNHPTQKPADLYKWLLERYCPVGGTILDPTAGSFTSCFTARDMGLHAIGIEMNDAYFKKAEERARPVVLEE